ncbi:hypothetical protein HMPREF9946_03091 [Acetobacteraceae bacterium AT-5844]|nr:hypothetical protein HMPREF9946_03091 [Acetobacteraceae bacterium AT-5844]
MSLSRYAIGLGQMPADEEGRCSSAVILYDPNTAKELIRLSYDTVGDILTGISDNPALAQQIAEAEKRGAERVFEAVKHEIGEEFGLTGMQPMIGMTAYARALEAIHRALPSQEPQG